MQEIRAAPAVPSGSVPRKGEGGGSPSLPQHVY